MSAKKLKLTVTIDTSELALEIEKIMKMTRPDCKLRFKILQKGLSFFVVKIKKWQFWKRHDFKIEIKPKTQFDFYMDEWKNSIEKFKNGENIK